MSSPRTYRQLCPIAYTLDVVGDRWTLLILRELQYSPRRFSDIMTGLDSAASNLVINRLRQLVQARLIRRRRLPPPAAADVYELTPRGRELRSVLDAMSRWGMELLVEEVRGDDHLSASGLLNVLEVLYRKPPREPVTCTLRMGDEVFSVTAGGPTLRILVSAPVSAAVVLEAAPKTVLLLAMRRLRPHAAITTGDIKLVRGSIEDLENFLAVFAG